MKKNIVIAVLAMGLILGIVFGVQQQSEAKRQEALAIENAAEAVRQNILAENAMNQAQMQMAMARQHAMEAERQRSALDEALKKCKGR